MSWDNALDVHKALEKAGLPVCGVSFGSKQVEATQFGATYVRCGTVYHRVDWLKKPTDEQKQAAAKIIGSGCDPACDFPEMIDSQADTYPADQPPLPPEDPEVTDRGMGFYTNPPFWGATAVEVSAPGTVSYVQAMQFRQQLAEVVFIYDSETTAIRVCRDGLILLRDKELEANSPFLGQPIENFMAEAVTWWSRYLAHLNCLNLLLDSCAITTTKIAWLHLAEITNQSALRIGGLRGNITSVGGGGVLNSHYQKRYLTPEEQNTGTAWMDLHRRFTIPREVFEQMARQYELVRADWMVLEKLSGLTKSLAEYKIGNYSISLVLAWFVIESVLAQKWRTWIDSKQSNIREEKRINSKRRSTMEGRDYPVSTVSNMLELLDLLPYDTYKSVNTVRGYRNDTVHQKPGFRCTAEHCQEAIQTALKLTLEGKPFTITPNLSYGISGP